MIVRGSDTLNKSDHGLVREFGISSATSHSQHLSMALGMVLPGTKSTRHYHPFETAVYVISGTARAYFGPNDEYGVDVAAGDFIYIPAGMIHSTENTGEAPVHYVLARAAAEDEAITADAERTDFLDQFDED